MTVIKNKPKNKAHKPEKPKNYAIRLTPELADGLRLISDKTHKTQIGILEEILTPMVQQAVSYESFTYEVLLDRNMVEIIFYGNHGNRMIFGKMGDDDEIAFAKMNSEIEKKLLGKSKQKVKVIA